MTESNVFQRARNRKAMSMRKIAETADVDRRIVSLIDAGQFDELRLIDLVKVSRVLEVNLAEFIRAQYGPMPGDVYEDHMDEVVNRLVWIQLTGIYAELSEFASHTKTRLDDFNLTDILAHKANLHRLIGLNHQLRKGEITRAEALRELPPTIRFDRRRTERKRDGDS